MNETKSIEYNIWSLFTFVICTMVTTITFSDTTGTRPSPTPELGIEFPNPGVLRPYNDPACAEDMRPSEVETINDDGNGTPWHYYTCTYNNNGWCSLNTGHCPEQVCHPYTDWIGPWNDVGGRDQADIVWHYTCVSIGSRFPFE